MERHSEKERAAPAKAREVVYVLWEDAESDNGWKNDSLPGVCVCESVGIVVAEDERSLTLALCVSEDYFNCTLCVPKSCVRARHKLADVTLERKGEVEEAPPPEPEPDPRCFVQAEGGDGASYTDEPLVTDYRWRRFGKEAPPDCADVEVRRGDGQPCEAYTFGTMVAWCFRGSQQRDVFEDKCGSSYTDGEDLWRPLKPWRDVSTVPAETLVEVRREGGEVLRATTYDGKKWWFDEMGRGRPMRPTDAWREV